MKAILQALTSVKNLDQSSLDYLQGQYAKLTDPSHHYTIRVTDFEGNATNHHTLNFEALIQLALLVQKTQALNLGVEAPPQPESMTQNQADHIYNILQAHTRECERQSHAATGEHKSILNREFADSHRAEKAFLNMIKGVKLK